MDREDKRVKNRSDLDFDVLKRLAEEPDEPKAVVTVIESKGSSPRGAGAKMIVYRDGRILGSIGGGCSEAAVLERGTFSDRKRQVQSSSCRSDRRGGGG